MATSSGLVPRVIAWESTKACNYACKHCRAEAQKQPDPNQLTTKEALNLVEQIADVCKPIFIISGGDPLKRSDIFEIASHASELGLRVVMSPSGSDITPDIISKMRNAGVQMISLSIDGSSADIHDSFRGVPGAFNLSLKAIQCAKEGGMPFKINTTVTQHNRADLSNICRLTIDLGAKEWDVFMLVPTGRGKVAMEITAQQYEDTLNFIYGLTDQSLIPIKMTCSPQYMRVIAQNHPTAKTPQPPRHGMGGRGCMAGNGFCFISHTGDVFGCGFLPIKAGNIRERKIIAIYQQSDFFTQLRQHNMLKGKCGACQFANACGGCRARALAVMGDYLESEPYCTYNP